MDKVAYQFADLFKKDVIYSPSMFGNEFVGGSRGAGVCINVSVFGKLICQLGGCGRNKRAM